MQSKIKNHSIKNNLIDTVEGLELLARRAVQGLHLGLHHSTKTGFGQEFSHYRNYEPGDDLRLLDWKLYARTDRFYVRQAEVQTQVTVRFILDASASMLHEDSEISKMQFARYLTATLAWIAQRQGDKIGLYALNNNQLYECTPHPRRQFYQYFLQELINISPQGKFPENKNIHALFDIRPRREIVIFLTDMYQSNDELFETLKQLNSMGNEVLLFHLMAANELNFNFKGTLTFQDLETGKTTQVHTRQAKADYQIRLQNHLKNIREKMLGMNIHYELFRMNEPVREAVERFLERRAML